MLCLKIEPGLNPYEIEVENKLSALQQQVDGFIETVFPFKDEDVVLICNEEGKLLNLEPNRIIFNDGYPMDCICGTFLLAGIHEDDFTSLTDEQIREYTNRFTLEDD